MVVAVKALACELPFQLGLPLSRISTADLQREVLARGIVASIGQTTLWRWLSEDAIKPWTYRSWVFPRDPLFAEILVQTPNHASWLNQIEIYFSIVQRKVLTPNDFLSLRDVPQRLAEFERYYEEVARPFQWKFTRKALAELLGRLAKYESRLAQVA